MVEPPRQLNSIMTLFLHSFMISVKFFGLNDLIVFFFRKLDQSATIVCSRPEDIKIYSLLIGLVFQTALKITTTRKSKASKRLLKKDLRACLGTERGKIS